MKVTIKDLHKTFYPRDNSYSKDLDTGESITVNNGYGLAGMHGARPVPVKIISTPFTMNVTFLGNNYKYEFVIVEYKNKAYIVLNDFLDVNPPKEKKEPVFMFVIID